jgi:hypothetical protein
MNWSMPPEEVKRLATTEPRTQRSGVSGRPEKPLTPLRCVRGSDIL